MGLSQDTDLLNDLQKEALLEPTEAAQSPYMDDPAYAGFETLRGLFGSNHGDNPSMYWLAQGKEMPEFATVADAQAAVWKDFQKKARAYQEEQERQQQAREALAATIDPFIDRYVRGDAVVPSPEQVMMMQEAGISWESVRRARRGMQLVREYDTQGILYDDRIINNLAEQVGDDELARRIVLNMFYNDARKYAKDKHGDEWTGIDWIDKAAQGVTGMVRTGGVKGWRTGQKAWRNLQVMGEVDAVTNAAKRLPELIASGMDVDEARAQIEKDATFLEIRRRWAADLVQTMEAGEKEYLEGEDRHLVGRIGSQLGSIIGDTAPWFIPAIGPAIGASSAMQSRRDEGVSIGLTMEETEKRAMMFGQADALEEMIAFSPIGRLTPGYKWLKKALGGGKAAGKLAPWRARWMASPKAQYAIQGLSGAAEESILEPTAGYLMRTVQSMNLTDERGKQTFRQYLDDMGQMMHGEQGLALLAFTFGMSGFNYPQIKKAAQEFGLSLQHYKELGGTAQGYLEAREEKTAEGFLNKALANLHDSWMEDPQASLERASAAAGERLSGERIESLRELDAWRAAEDAGMVPRVEPAEQEGMFRVYAPARSTKAPREDASVSREGEEEDAPSYTLMDGEQMTAYLQAFVSEQVESDILYTQHLLAGDVTVRQALAQGRFDAAEVITRTVTDEKTGAERVVIAPETLGQMKARADMAMAAIRALEAEGVSYEDAADRMDASLSEHLPLGTLVKTWEEAQERIRTEQARNPEFKVPAMDAPFSNAYVTKVRRGDTFRRVLRYARGNATVEDLMEETMEQAVISWQAEQGLTWGEFGAMLQEAQRVMNELFPEARGEEMQFIHLDAGKPVTGHDAIEAFSKIGRSRWLADAVNHPSLPSWLRKLLNHLVKFLGAFKARVELGEMVRQAEEQGVFTLPVRQALAVMLDAGNALYRDQQGDLMELSMERARAQAELDAMFGAGVATEARTLEDELAESRKEDEERRKEAEDEARAPENSPEAQEARREREQARVEALGEPDGSGVFNGAFIEVQEGVRLGFIDKNKLTLCPDVPQFKQGADEQTGVVNPIVGAWQRNAAPISVWRREDGSLQVISGRHRFNACTDEDINCTVYDEAAGFDLDWAQTHDVENNIRDGQASLFEIARYVSQKGLTKEEAVERGIFRKGQSRRGVELGMYGCSDLLDALGNELVSPDDAWRVAMAFRNQTEVQRAGLRALMEGKSWQQAFAVMQVAANMDRIRGLAEATGMTFETDLFGNSHAEEYFARLAQYAAARVSELTREISSISGASRRPETARKYGVDVRDAGALEAVVKDLKAQRARWQNFGLHEDLIKEANDAVMVELGVKTREEVDRENGVLPLEAPEQEAVSADTGMLQLSQDVSRMLDAALARGAAPAEDEAPAANFSLVSIPSGEVITTAAEMRARLKPLQGKVFVNKNTGIQAVIEARVSGKTVGKAGAAQMSVANLKALGFSAEEARRVHYTAAARIHELFENAEDGFFEEAYKQDSSKAGAYHFFNTVDIGGIGAFDVNVTAIKYVKEQEGNVLYTLELTIENPAARGAASREGRLPTPFKDGVSTRNLSSYRSFVEKEKAAVRKKAVADGTFMKAPNGANTNLTEDQWLAVRTAAFKNWFGDWEHDPQNASKVVDENGEPRVVYHGSHQWFTSFNDGKQRQQSGAPAGTIFANDNREIAVSFADYYGGHADEVILDPNDERHPRYSWGIYREGGIYDLFMNVRNPLVVDFEGRPWLDSSKGGDINALCSKAKESGHDGVIALNIVDVGLNDQENVPASTDYVAFDSVQVKSAAQNRGTYDPKNPDITFSIVSAQEQGLFRDGHFEAGNAVITEPGVTFSIAALHASPHSFRKFDTAFMGKGEGAQAYGWGLYFAENPKVNRSYMNQFAQDKATWKFREVETGVIEVMQRSLVGSFLPKDALPEAKEDASDIAWSVLGDLVDAARGSMTVLDIVMELHDEIDTNRKYAETYPQEREKLEQLEGFMLSLLDHLDEIEVRTGMPSNYRVELNVEDSELMGWDYVDETVLALLKDSPVEEVRYALERAERRADDCGENVNGKDVYQELFDAFWDGEDGTKQEAQKAASVSLLSSDIKGIKYADGYTRNKAEEEQTYNYVIFDGNDIKITAFADESTGGAWADYEDPTATFSIIGEKAESFQEYHNNGLSYTDPADGKRKAIIDSRGVRLRKEHVSVSEGGHVNVSLAAALDFPELFRAYPELRKLRVDFYRDSRSGTGGFTDPQEHYIAVNVARGGKNAAPGMVLDTILHEVQHVIQGYEGFAVGAGNMSREQALAYLGESMSQLAGRDDAWAKEALPRLERMRQELETGTLQPAFVYVFSHGEQEARLAGSFEKNSEGVVMSGLNGFRLLDAPPFSIPLTGDITELGGITFGAGRFGRMADRVLAPNGDWLYDEMVFRMRAATQRSVSKLRLFETGDRERGLELLAEAQELISTVERYLPGSYGFGLEPYKIWLNVFSLLYGNSGKMAPGDAVSSALEAIPMKRWPEIMEGSIGKSFVNWAEKRPELEDVVEEARREIAERQADYELDSAPDADNRAALAARKGVEQEVWRRLFEEHGAEFLEEYGEQKVFRLVGKFMERVVEQIDRFRKDRTLGRIRRVAASVAPRTNPKGKPLRGKMDAESYRRLERCLRLLEMTESQYDEFFQKNFPEDAEEGKRWEDLAPDALVLVTLPDAEGRLEEVAVTQREFEVYACYERMDVNTAEKCGAALGELIATSRHAWENAAEKKKMEVAAMAAPLLQATGDLDDSRMATFRRKARLRALPKKPLSLFDYLMNFNQYMQALSSVGPFAGIARQFEERAARFNVQRQASEKEMLRFVHNTVAEIAGSADRYDIAEWIYEGRMKQDTGISVVEREPDWNRKANALYRERLLHLLRRKVKSHGLEAVQLYLREFKFSEGLKKEVNALFGHRRKEISAKQAKKALEHMERVFTQNEWERYGDQKVFVRERAEMLRSRTKYAKEGYQPKSFRLDGLSRMEAAYLVLLSEQADYTEALAERGFDAEVMDRLRGFAGDEVMQFAYALREKLNERSEQVQEMTERRYGTPFPLTENYFRAFFDVTMEAIDKSIADAASYGEAATGGKFGLIHARRKHQAHLDLEMDVCTAFMAAMTEQDLYLYGSEISRDLRALLNFKGEDGEAGRSLEVLLGRDAVGKLMAWADAFDRAGAESIRGHLDMNRLMNRLSGAAARVLLAGRVGTLTKQATTVINAMYASDEIGLAEWLGSVRRYHAGKLVKPVREIEALPELDSRDKTRFSATLAAMGADEAGRRVSRLERWNREGMDLLERVDMKGNAISAAILYDAVYRKMKRETPDAAEAELDAAAMAEVRRSLSRKGQPMTQLQKSLTAQHRTWMQAGMLFLGGESINTMGNVFSLARSGQWGKAGLMWVSHGVVLALLNGLLNFMTDDEKRRRKREWWHALFDVAMGPVMGIPVVNGLAGEGVRQLAKLCGYHAFMPGNNLLVPFSNAADIGKAFSNAWKVFDGKERPWEDDALSFHELLRTAAAGTVAFSPRTTKGGAAAVGAALTMAALLNVTEFALKTVRSVQENGADWDKWVGK